MKKKRSAILISTIFLALLNSFAQEQSTVASAADIFSKSKCSITWTLGECVVGENKKSDCTIGNGFLRGNINVQQVSVNPGKNRAVVVKLYPNPVSDFINIELKEPDSAALASIYSLSGKLLKKSRLSQFITGIDVSALPPGTYLLKLDNNKSSIGIYKIIKY